MLIFLGQFLDWLLVSNGEHNAKILRHEYDSDTMNGVNANEILGK